MKSIKTRLTHLKTKVTDILPDENDLLGFPGISKVLILESMATTYGMLDLIAPFETKFETILLKRRIAESIDKAVEFLKDKFKNQDPDDFNKFLNKVADMHYAVKETYVLFTKEPIRLDIALNKAKENLIQLEDQSAQIQPIVKNLENAFLSSNIIIETLTKNNNDSSSKLTEILSSYNSSLNLKKKVETASNSIAKSEQEVLQTKTEITTYQAQILDLFKKMQSSFEQLITHKSDFETSLNSLQASITRNDIHQQNIQETIDNVNRLGMAASFKKRKDELEKPYWAWGIATIATICVLIYSSFSVLTILKDKPFSYEYLLVRIPVFASFVWLGWFCAKQFGFVSRIREDYSFKYAVSMAFEGYKNATKEINVVMLENLLSLTLQNISSNPLNIYETGTNHGTPFNEVISGWVKKGKVKQNPTKTNGQTNIETITKPITNEDD